MSIVPDTDEGAAAGRPGLTWGDVLDGVTGRELIGAGWPHAAAAVTEALRRSLVAASRDHVEVSVLACNDLLVALMHGRFGDDDRGRRLVWVLGAVLESTVPAASDDRAAVRDYWLRLLRWAGLHDQRPPELQDDPEWQFLHARSRQLDRAWRSGRITLGLLEPSKYPRRLADPIMLMSRFADSVEQASGMAAVSPGFEFLLSQSITNIEKQDRQNGGAEWNRVLDTLAEVWRDLSPVDQNHQEKPLADLGAYLRDDPFVLPGVRDHYFRLVDGRSLPRPSVSPNVVSTPTPAPRVGPTVADALAGDGPFKWVAGGAPLDAGLRSPRRDPEAAVTKALLSALPFAMSEAEVGNVMRALGEFCLGTPSSPPASRLWINDAVTVVSGQLGRSRARSSVKVKGAELLASIVTRRPALTCSRAGRTALRACVAVLGAGDPLTLVSGVVHLGKSLTSSAPRRLPKPQGPQRPTEPGKRGL